MNGFAVRVSLFRGETRFEISEKVLFENDFFCSFEAHRVASENEGFKRGVSSLRALPPDVHHALEKKGVPPTDDSFKYKWNIAQREYDPVRRDSARACGGLLRRKKKRASLLSAARESGEVCLLDFFQTSESTPCTSRIEAIWTGEALQV